MTISRQLTTRLRRALLDQRIPIKMGTALLYSLQLALQAKISYFGLCHREPVRECSELDMELEMERAKAMRPAKEKCARCPKQDDCLSPRNCRKLPPGYRRAGDHLVRDTTTNSSSRAKVATLVEGPASSPLEATTLAPTSPAETTTDLLREHSPAGNCGEQAPPKFLPSRANARRQIQPGTENRELRTKPAENGEQRTENLLPLNILRSNPNAFIDLPGKFPELIENNE